MDGYLCQSQALQHRMPSDDPMRLAWFGFGLDCKHCNAMDNEIVSTLAASWETHRRLKMAATTVQGALMALGLVHNQVELYGSLSMGRPMARALTSVLPQRLDVPGCFITDLSDVDCAVLLQPQWPAAALVKRFTEAARTDQMEWWQVQATVVPRFSVTQWTMVSDQGVHLDLTCFSDVARFNQFRARQEAFRRTFWQMRRRLRDKHGEAGADAFDAYIYLLKAFAALTLRSTLTSFQAICLGLHAVQRRNKSMAPTGLGLMKLFLVFCRDFFSCECPAPTSEQRAPASWYGTSAIDVSSGKLIDRCSRRARTELYFADAEYSLQLRTSDWMNVLHNVDPNDVSRAASVALDSWYSFKAPKKVWGRVKKDLANVMQFSQRIPR